MNEKMRILLADDDTEFCARMSAVLDSADDFELVGIAENGEKALSAVNELRPDVLIIELMLPVMDGMSVLSRLHEQDGPHPAVMVFSAFASPQIGAECAALGVDLFLRKPMEPQADLPTLPVQLPMSSAVGAAMKATSMTEVPFSMSEALPPWLRKTTGLSMMPSEIALPTFAPM